MVDEPSRTVVEEVLTIAAAADEVWRAIVDNDARAHWWAYLDLDAAVGAAFEESWRDADGRLVQTSGQVIDAIPPRLLRLSWRDDGWPAATEVALRLEPSDGGTSVEVVHAGWEHLPDGASLAEEHRAGWRMHLRNLRDHVEDHDGAART